VALQICPIRYNLLRINDFERARSVDAALVRLVHPWPAAAGPRRGRAWKAVEEVLRMPASSDCVASRSRTAGESTGFAAVPTTQRRRDSGGGGAE
jgi:hypothetical protein